MKVLVIGGGGREHALCWKLSQSPLLEKLYCAPGNPGIAAVAERVPIEPDEIQSLVDFSREQRIDLTVVGPEMPLTLGIADTYARHGLALFGPSQRAAELEGSKVFAKEFMQRHQIPTAPFVVVNGLEEARGAVAEFGFPAVLKADGLAAGKGVLIPRDEEELEAALDTLFVTRRFGRASDRVVVESHLSGEEVSLIAVSDGHRLLPLASSKDYKRIGEGDQGPNTGGMGAHSPSGVLSTEDAVGLVEMAMQRTVEGMAEEGRPFIGVLYAGIILTVDGPRVLEFNVRLGDPEAQPLLLRLESDLLPALAAGAAGDFGEHQLEFVEDAAACIVLAAAGYPARPVKGEEIRGLEEAAAEPTVEIFHAGTGLEEGRVVSAGGRVLNVCATAPGLEQALERAYRAADRIDWPGKVLRRDIGRRVVELPGS